jgi:hypothetical protein
MILNSGDDGVSLVAVARSSMNERMGADQR